MKTVISLSGKSRDDAYDANPSNGTSVNFANLVHALAKVNNTVSVVADDILLYVETRDGRPLARYDLEMEEAWAPTGKKLPSLKNY